VCACVRRITDFGFTRKMGVDGRIVVAKQNHNLPVRIGAPESLVGDAAEYSAKVRVQCILSSLASHSLTRSVSG
jgi:hypothetical protein